MSRFLLLLAAVATIGLVACGPDDGDADDGDAGDGTSVDGGQEFTLASSPEFVNRMIPGRRPVALVTADGATGDAIALAATASLAGASVSVEPAEIEVGDVAEVWIDLPDVDEEREVIVTIVGQRGDVEQQLAVTATAVPGVDDLEPTARDIVAIFLDELAGEVEGLPADPSGLSNGTPVAGLLVVSHYAWFTDELEIGLAWHIMIAPDDFSELYVRPRGALAPTAAFRLDSWSTALAGGAFTMTEIPPPAEVTR